MILFSNCNSNKSIKLDDSVKCDFIDTDKFEKVEKKISASRKPNSISDAIRLLDSLADDNFRCAIIKYSDKDLYFSLGLLIRNQWVRHGTDSIRYQLFYKLRLSHIDYTSGLILDIYKQCLINKDVDLAKRYLKDNTDSLFTMKEKEFKTIQKDLFFLSP